MLCHVFRHIVLFRVLPDVVQQSFIYFILLCLCIFTIFLVAHYPSFLSSLICGHTISIIFVWGSLLFFFKTAFSPDVLNPEGALLGFSSCPSQHSHLTGVEFLWIFVLECPTFRPVCHRRLDYGFVDIIFGLDRHVLITDDSRHVSSLRSDHLDFIIHVSLWASSPDRLREDFTVGIGTSSSCMLSYCYSVGIYSV